MDIKDVSSERRNPVMAQLDYMEKRGSGLTRICNETKALDGYKDELKTQVQIYSDPIPDRYLLTSSLIFVFNHNLQIQNYL